MSERDELGRLPGEGNNSSELGRSEALHIDAMSEEGVPGQVIVRVSDEDSGASQDRLSVLLPYEIELPTTARDFQRDVRFRFHLLGTYTNGPSVKQTRNQPAQTASITAEQAGTVTQPISPIVKPPRPLPSVDISVDRIVALTSVGISTLSPG